MEGDTLRGIVCRSDLPRGMLVGKESTHPSDRDRAIRMILLEEIRDQPWRTISGNNLGRKWFLCGTKSAPRCSRERSGRGARRGPHDDRAAQDPGTHDLADQHEMRRRLTAEVDAATALAG
jgi:hypothetical protein